MLQKYKTSSYFALFSQSKEKKPLKAQMTCTVYILNTKVVKQEKTECNKTW